VKKVFGRKSLPVGVLVMLLVLALATLGLGYGLWSKTLYINGTVGTGKVDAIFITAFTDDDNKVDDADKDPGDIGTCINDPNTSCDPSSPGPKPTRYDKDVGLCVAVIDPNDAEKATVTVSTGYPSYYCTMWFDIKNNGTIPLKIQSLTLIPANFTNGLEVTVALSQLAKGQQIDPYVTDDDLAQGDIHIHVEQEAGQGASYSFSAELLLVQWNEYKP